MNPIILALFGLLTHVDTLEADAIDIYSTIAHGEGGIDKVRAAVGKLGKLIEDAATGATPQIPVSQAVVAARTQVGS